MRWKLITTYPNRELEEKWFDFLPDSTYPSHYTSPGFFNEPFWENRNPFAALIFDEDKVSGVLTGLRAGKKIVSGLETRPQVSIAKTADQKRVAAAFIEALLSIARDGEIVSAHCSEQIEGFEEAGFSVKKADGSFRVVMLDLTAGKDEIFKGFSQTRRSDLRKAMRENKIRVSPIENVEELEELHKIHVAWCNRKQIEPDKFESMKKMYRQKDYHRIFVAKLDGKIIAGSYFRYYKKALMEYAGNNSLPEYQHLRPNELLVWRSIEWACENEIPLYSMGASHPFLQRFGGEIVSSYRYQLDRTIWRRHEKKEAIENFAIKTYQNLPVSMRHKIKKILGKD